MLITSAWARRRLNGRPFPGAYSLWEQSRALLGDSGSHDSSSSALVRSLNAAGVGDRWRSAGRWRRACFEIRSPIPALLGVSGGAGLGAMMGIAILGRARRGGFAGRLACVARIAGDFGHGTRGSCGCRDRGLLVVRARHGGTGFNLGNFACGIGAELAGGRIDGCASDIAAR